MKYLTIDFETASRYEYSPCSVSIYEFDNGNQKNILSTLINPGDIYFDPALTEIHGITAEMVQNAPHIKDILKEICTYIKDNFIFAHNASFDISKIIEGCKIYDIYVPNFEYADSLMISKRTWPGLINYKLDTVSEFLDIELNHHNADSDALACGMIIEKALQKNEASSLDELLNITKYVKGSYIDNTWQHAYSKKLYSGNSKSDYDKIKNISINDSADGLLAGKYIAFTGALSLTREEAMQKAADVGAIPAAGVTKKTNYLVVGVDDYGKFKEGNKSNKMLKAEQLILAGQDLEIITEDDFLDMISIK